jgi:hypothetical protein
MKPIAPRRSTKRIIGLVVAATALSVAGGIATAAVITPGVNGPGLAAVGPTSASDGFPVWYKDRNGLRLENCVALADPFCPARGTLPDETAPISFPDNYPDEGFYSLADTGSISSGNGGKARLVIALEQAFGAGPVSAGDQVTFARVRIKISNLTDGVDYTITTPAGVKTLQTDKAGLIFNTEDIGIGSPGDFTGALGGRIGPFLTWDTFPRDPALKPDVSGKDTYIGDGATPHTITGSPYGAASNVFRIEGPGINPTPTVDACPTVAGPLADCLETTLFTIQGKLATTSGVNAQQATYSRSSSGAGTVDVFASSELGPQAIQVSDASAGAAEFDVTGVPGGGDGHFFTRVAYTGAQPPTDVRVTNTGDVPPSSKVIKVVDGLTGTATYNTGSQQLTVNAVSSDTAAPRTLTVTGYGTLTSGSLVVGPLTAPPPTVTVTSDAGGSVTLPVGITGGAATPIPAVAQAGPDQTVSAGQLVTLDGSASTQAQTFSWTSPAGITLANPTTATPTFTAPQTPGDYTFSLTVTGPGGPSTASVTITVNPAVTAVANAGPNQTGVQRGTKVTLDGSASVGAGTFAWTQVVAAGDPTVNLTGANTAKPSFTFPFYKFPANTGALTFNLHITSPDGSSSDAQVTVTPSADTVNIAKGQYTTSKKEWRVDGTSSVLAGETVTVHLGGLNGPVIGSAVVDNTGAWSVRATPNIVGTNGQTVSAESQLGGTRTGFAIRVQ